MGDQEEFLQLSQWSFHPVKGTRKITWDQQIMAFTLTSPDKVPVIQQSHTTRCDAQINENCKLKI